MTPTMNRWVSVNVWPRLVGDDERQLVETRRVVLREVDQRPAGMVGVRFLTNAPST